MVPHVFGWFTMSSVWFILCVQLENAKRDIAEVSDRRMPDWVDAVIYGSFLIFMSFALVQIIFQRLAPGFYWGAPMAHCTRCDSAPTLGHFPTQAPRSRTASCRSPPRCTWGGFC
jgi:hypothetical protein